MTEADTIRLARGIEVALADLRFVHARSGGPGGQNVNKVNTRVTLLFDLTGSAVLSPAQKERISARLASRISSAGVLRVVSSRHRTQAANRAAALGRFVELLNAALHEDKPRRPTRITAGAHARRLQGKTRRAQTKRGRGWRSDEE